jgi:hypothetical protein
MMRTATSCFWNPEGLDRASAKVVITTMQRLYSMLKGEPDLDPALEEGSQFAARTENRLSRCPSSARPRTG